MILPYTDISALWFVAQWDWDPEPDEAAAEPAVDMTAELALEVLAEAAVAPLLARVHEPPAPASEAAPVTKAEPAALPRPAALEAPVTPQAVVANHIRWAAHLVRVMQENPGWQQSRDEQADDSVQRRARLAARLKSMAHGPRP